MGHCRDLGKHATADVWNRAFEIYVAIIVGSMPAFASFFNGQMPGVSLLASIISLVRRTRHAASSSRVRLSRRTSAELRSSEEFIIPNGYERDKGYLELRDTRRPGENEMGSNRTNIRGEGPVPRDLEEGVVRKTVTAQQSRQLPPATQVSR